MKITKMVSIDNYEAGVKGNRFVALVDELKVCPSKVKPRFRKEREVSVPLLLATSKILDDKFVDKLEAQCDEVTPCNEVILVCPKFLKLSNKTQLALLRMENLKWSNYTDIYQEAFIEAELVAREEFGNWCVDRALRKEEKIQKRSKNVIGKLEHRAYKKNNKCAKKSGKEVEEAVNEAFEDEDFCEV